LLSLAKNLTEAGFYPGCEIVEAESSGNYLARNTLTRTGTTA